MPRLADVRRDLAALEQSLVGALGTERTRRRGALVRELHEVRQMLRGPVAYPFVSQAGQDMIVDRLLGGRRGGVFADIGGYDGVTGSNTLFFEKWRGWTGLLVEPVAKTRAAAEATRACPCLPYAVDAEDGTADFVEVTEGYTQMSGLAEGYDPGLLQQVRADPRHREATVTVETRTLARILDESDLPTPDFVSLDIEGGEVRVLESFPFSRHKVAVWAIENNTGTPRIAEVMQAAGYVLAEVAGPDEIWRRADLSV